ncbi:hypothetical protein ACFS5J_04125 [Flavobacterium chuncheonense]|uniref:Uncharacterized protein n=1 Tax=Flavobacterium chuncheonense TaxID=2026653 RepID=A0ABW5YJX4_9FLAO
MNYFEFLKSKAKLIVIWFIVNGLALFVNIFEIKGRVYFKNRHGGYLSGRDNDTVNFFTTNTYQNDFWPFVDFFDNADNLNRGFIFRGIFLNYDISEFIAFSLLIFIILYFNFEAKNKK